MLFRSAIGSQAISGVLVAGLASFKGVRLPYAPMLQYSFRADYDTEITPELAGFVGVGVNGQSKSYSALVLQGSQPFGADASLYDINARTLVNANIGVRSVADRGSEERRVGKGCVSTCKYRWSRDH